MTDSPAGSRHSTTEFRASRRTFAWILGLLIAVHSFLVLLWVAPVNPMRDAVGNERLTTYINKGHFEQSWSVFAPTPRRLSDTIRLRALVKDPKTGQVSRTEWVDVTALVTRKIKYDITPPRVEEATRRLGSRINAAMFKFNQDQKLLVQGSYITTSTDELAKAMLAAKGTGAGDVAEINAYILYDEMLTRFASMYTEATFGGKVTQIQYKVGYQAVPPYAQRNTVKVSDVRVTNWDFGWRKAIPGTKDAQRAFDGYVEGLEE
ncbi:DUF5819 family protein [Aeromicrobium sp.]|uniref:DUF5819 family protein n=1 Tax=Aeromicrobium sp. TaxID=1871063 RepID=UPI0030C1FEEF